MDPSRQGLFDEMLEQIIKQLPEHLHALLEEVPLIVEDEPAPRLLSQLGLAGRNQTLCGLHYGIPLTRRRVEFTARLPDQMMLFRGPIMRVARFRSTSLGRHQRAGELRRQIRLTLLHEIGHHFGLNEEELADLGYG